MTDQRRRRTSGHGPGPEPGRRLEDHAAIERLADELLPSLIAKLGATGLGEIEVREGDWKVRLRRPADAPGLHYGRRASDRPSRAQPGHEGHGHAPAAVEPGALGFAPGALGFAPVALGFAPGAAHPANVATSPAVGFFQPRPGMTAGTRVRAGDTIATVDVLGVPQEVVAPVDGLIGASFVEPGEAVEYGQELIRIELATASAPAPAGSVASAAESVTAPEPATAAALPERA